METKHHSSSKQGLVNTTSNFNLLPNTQINLPVLFTRLEKTSWIKISNGHPAYLQISFEIDGVKNSFKIFRNGGVTVWYSITPKAWHHLLDFFYYNFIINSLEDLT